MKLASWNVNSIRARQERVLSFLDKAQPDVLCMQELKVTTDKFPYDALREAGYFAVAHGQKTYNGVAIASRSEPANVRRGLEDDEEDPQARLISAEIGGVRVISAYVPNGQVVGSEKYAYKLRWLERLRSYLERTCDPGLSLALCGDFNVAPEDRDVADLETFNDSVLCHSDARKALEQVVAWGLVDTFRMHHPEDVTYTWWDYRQLAFPRNVGLRIDHVFATRPLARRCVDAGVDRDERKGKQPSDHAPTLAVFEV